MKSKTLKTLAFLLVIVLLVSAFPQRSAAKDSITLTKSQASIMVGSTTKIVVKNVPASSKITYQTKNSKIASVSTKGVVKGKKMGKTTIIITVKKKKRKLATLKFSVSVKQKTKSVGTKPELTRASSYGLVPAELASGGQSRDITWKEYCTLLYNMLKKVDASAAQKWKKDAARALKSNKAMKRYQGCFALYRASEFLGENHRQQDNGGGYLNPYETDYGDESSYNDFTEYTGDHDEWTYQDIKSDYGTEHMYRSVAMLYSYERTSLISFETCYTADKLPSEMLTVEDAILSVVRLYESRAEFAKQYWLKQIDVVENQLEALETPEIRQRRESILSSETTIKKGDKYIPGKTYTGTAYYVSADGNDENDGTSPETAWKTIDRVIHGDELSYGDAIFFERGHTYRGTLYLYGTEGLTVSAYGTGAKPILTTAQEAAEASLWELYSEIDGKKIWKFRKKVSDCGSIVFDDSFAGSKVLAKWSKKKKKWRNWDGSSFDVVSALTQDFDFFSDDGGRFGGAENYNVGGEGSMNDRKIGPLYLRCDAGNPGELFSDIELCTIPESPFEDNHPYCGDVADSIGHSTFDNLSIRYYAHSGACLSDHSIIQNCEFAWGGGCVQIVENGWAWGRAGDAIVGGGIDQTVKNCYFHDLFTQSMILESPNRDYKNVTYTNNLTERCIPINMDLEQHKIKNLTISDNYFVGAGTGWGPRSMIRGRQWQGSEWFFCIRMRQSKFSNSRITGNQFIAPAQFAIYEQMVKELPAYSNNKFVFVSDTSYLAFWCDGNPSVRYRTILPGAEKAFLEQTFKDTASTVERK